MVGLAWLAKVGWSSLEPLSLIIGCGERVAYGHVSRLVSAGLVRRVPMIRGWGSLIMVTAAGARVAGLGELGAPRSAGPGSWEDMVACSWVGALLELDGRSWISGRELARDPRWSAMVTYEDWQTGQLRRAPHHPDLGLWRLADGPASAIEVHLRRKTRETLDGRLEMYRQRTASGQLADVTIITASSEISDAIARAGERVGLAAGHLRIVPLEDVIKWARAARRAPSPSKPYLPQAPPSPQGSWRTGDVVWRLERPSS